MTQAAKLAQLGSPGISTGFKNRIINGAFNIWQRGTTITSVGIDTFGPDRFKQWAQDGSETGRATWSQSTDVPTGQGFQYSSKLAVTTAQASFTSSQGYSFEQRIEANNIYDLAYGTAGAKSTTLSFWAKSTKTGTYTVAVSNNGTSATNVYKQTVSLTSSWAKYEITIPGDTSLATTSTGTNQGMFVCIMLSNGTTSAVTSAWQSYSLANRTATGQVNFYDSTSNELYITGVQLEVGTTATDFEYLDYGRQLIQCQRYYENIGGTTASGDIVVGAYATGASQYAYVSFPFAVVKRTAPTVTKVGTWTTLRTPQPAVANPSTWGFRSFTQSTGSGDFYAQNDVTGTYFSASAEL